MIRSDNEINQIKKIDWYNQNGISFEPYLPNTYAQNGGIKRFKQLIIEKAQAIRLLANLLHKL